MAQIAPDFISSFNFSTESIDNLAQLCDKVPGIYHFYGIGNNGKTTLFNQVFTSVFKSYHFKTFKSLTPNIINNYDILFCEDYEPVDGENVPVIDNPIVLITNKPLNFPAKKIIFHKKFNGGQICPYIPISRDFTLTCHSQIKRESLRRNLDLVHR